MLIILEANDSSLEYLYLLDHPVERGLVGNFHEGHSPSIATRNPIRVTHCPARGYHSQPSKGRTHNPARVFSRSASIDYHSGGAAAPQRGAGLLPPHSGSLSSTEKGGVYVATRHRCPRGAHTHRVEKKNKKKTKKKQKKTKKQKKQKKQKKNKKNKKNKKKKKIIIIIIIIIIRVVTVTTEPDNGRGEPNG